MEFIKFEEESKGESTIIRKKTPRKIPREVLAVFGNFNFALIFGAIVSVKAGIIFFAVLNLTYGAIHEMSRNVKKGRLEV